MESTPNIIPIHTLDPTSSPPSSCIVRAIVTLSWPYSSATKQCALLLSDPDFRLRNRRGQVRVRFSGACARAVAQAKIGIGDEVLLNLQGGVWEEDVERERTPGRGVEAALWFGKGKVGMRITKEGVWQDIMVDQEEEQDVVQLKEKDRLVTRTPAPKAVARLRDTEAPADWTYASPAFAKRVRLSGEDLVHSAYDPFALRGPDAVGDDGGMRKLFGDRMNWRWYTGKTPSPTKETFAQLEASPIRQERDAEEVVDSQQRSMLPPRLPQVEVPIDTTRQPLGKDAPVTPKLLPIKSPTLPLPSPFPTDTAKLPFSLGDGGASITDAASSREQLGLDNARSSLPSVAERQDQDREREPDVIDLLSDSEVEDEDPALLGVEGETLEPRGGHTFVDGPQAPMILTPQKHSIVALDGASSTPASTHVTPQSEKDRVMKKTFQSLFGFKESPEPQQITAQSAADRDESPTPRARLSDAVRSRLKTASDNLVGESVDAPEVIGRAPGDVKDVRLMHDDGKAAEAVATKENAAPSPDRQRQIEVIELESDFEEEQEVEVREDNEQPHPPPALSSIFSPDIRDSPEDANARGLVTAETLHDFDKSQRFPVTDVEPAHYGAQEVREHDSVPIAGDEAQSQTDNFLQHKAPIASLSPSLRSQVTQATATESMFPGIQNETSDTMLDPSTAAEPDVVEQRDHPKSTAGHTVVELDSSSPVEPAQQPAIYPSLSVAQTEEAASYEEGEVSQQQSISYPSLPMSPSNSQTLTQMSQPPVDSLRYETSMPMLPPTPQLTQASSSMKAIEDGVSTVTDDLQRTKRREALQTADDVHMSEDDVDVDKEISSQNKAGKELTPARRSIASRSSNVPEVISAWFSPKQSLAVSPQGPTTIVKQHQSRVEPKLTPLKPVQANGLSTAHAYFTPLSRLEQYLNPSSQLSYGTQTVDVFAVVTAHTTEPARAKGGPRDYYTILRIADSTISLTSDVRVEMFRPWKATLPVAGVGDVVLLRAFAIKSRRRRAYLLSTDASAWCVWRHEEASIEDGKRKKPIWAQTAGEQSQRVTREEINGPPVEFGDAERRHAHELRLWWDRTATGQGEADGYDDNNAGYDDEGHDSKLNGRGLQAVAAKN